MFKRIFTAVFLIINLSVSAQNDTVQTGIVISDWLIAGPYTVSLPAFFSNEKSGLTELLNFDQVDIPKVNPSENTELKLNSSQMSEWKIFSNISGELKFSLKDSLSASIYYCAIFVDAKRWLKGTIDISSCGLFKVYLNGEEILSKTTSSINENGNCDKDKSSKEIKLERGKHIIIIKAIADISIGNEWTVAADFRIKSPFTPDDIIFATLVPNYTSIFNLLDDPKIGNISISPDGELAAVTVSQIKFGTDQRESWIDIYKTKDGSLFWSLKGGMNPSDIKWGPKGKTFSYTSSSKEETSLWISDFETGNTFLLLDRIKDFGSYNWSPAGDFIIYSVTEKPKEDKTGLKRFLDINDRWPYARNRGYLYKVSLSDRSKQRLTAGSETTTLQSISSDGKTAIISITGYDLTQHTYIYTEIYFLNLETLEVTLIEKLFRASSAQFSPDNEKILILGSPAVFGNAGINVPNGMTPNEFDTQAYIYDIKTRNVEAITREFNPSITSAVWHKKDSNIYFLTVDKTLRRLYKYDVKKKNFALMNLNVEVISGIDFSNENLSIVYKGSGAIEPERFYFAELRNQKSLLLFDPYKNESDPLKTGDVKKWTFINIDGVEIDGLVYYPVDFDSSQKYPCIVYYYGGTTPAEQFFEGRYPRNVWTSNGYFVYVLQPSGATGYGQQFSAYHVNDWGNRTAEEVIQGTKLFLADHPYIDKDRVGCIGASYGGFLTMNILTKTDMFRTGISHAGISSISSYWGEGFWGWQYNSVSAANSFPWNRRDIYVDQSPLYNADKITSPLLLLHGAADTNVPRGESWQMYTALKMLGREVEYVEVADLDHHIMEYNKRKLWTKTIIAWFDAKLKDQPEWWNDLYPAK